LKKDKAEELTEVISILVERLSQTEFARVQCIMTSDTVVGDPDFPQMLAMAFRHVPRTVCGNIKPCRSDGLSLMHPETEREGSVTAPLA
jgi:hypothetical protein